MLRRRIGLVESAGQHRESLPRKRGSPALRAVQRTLRRKHGRLIQDPRPLG
jgi:hypothetical protein